LAAHALVVGAGGLGSPVALYLATAGVGRITLVDHDTVDLTNLQRQIAHTLDRVGHTKVDSAAAAMAAINPEVRVHTVHARADAALLGTLVARYSATGEPSPPAPTTSAWAANRRSWPSIPMSSSRMWRE